MIHRFAIRAALIASAAALLFGCATSTKPITEYGYSSWVSRHGVNSKGEFERARKECFERFRIEDPASVEKDGPTERNFAKCMQTKGWCTNSGSCR